MKLINEKTGQEVKVGDQIVSFRDEVYILQKIVEPHKPSSTGKVYATPLDGGMTTELYPSVFDLKIVGHQFDN